MSNSDKKDPSKDSEPRHKRIVSGSGETILPENSPSEQETSGAEDTELGSGFRLPEEFTLIRRLGRGGMGEVYLVERDSGFSREQLALKTILPEHLGNEGAIERFKREVSTLLRLKHEHIVQLRDFRLYRGYYYFLMEYIEGVTLHERVAKQGALSTSEVLNVFGPLAQALDYAHGKGVIHRDLKPSNIMLGPEGTVYLLDFGIARHQESEQTATRRMGPGTWEYMSPEQFDDEDPSASMDVYGLGATIYYALTGKHPFDATALRKLILQKDKGCPDVSKLGLADGIAEGLELSLHPNSGSRPKSCGELIALMRGVGRKKTEPSAPLPPPAPSKPVVPAEQKPVVTAEVKPAAKPAAPEASRSQALPEELTNSIGTKLRLIQPGTFMMGSPASEAGRGRDEGQHQVTPTKQYYMGIYPVTIGDFKRFVDKVGYKTEGEQDGKGAYVWTGKEWVQDAKITWRNPGFTQTAQDPVVCVSWNDAESYCQWVSEVEGKSYRLPTESEWEYGCRAGSRTAYCFGDGEARLGEYAWYDSNSGNKTHAVGQKKPNAWGLYDMHGNVWEWCSDWYGEYPSGAVTDPTGASTGSSRVLRGGGWYYAAAGCRSAYRRGSGPSDRDNDLGFRLALSSLVTSPAAERGR
jgi:formylglycine-generating enzyme required for sulfatase activity/predicted Ser/Thr protein kinase